MVRVIFAAGILASVALAQGTAPMPVVDLGYQRHQAIYNATGRYYKFANIRYAAPPIGDLRFSAPQAPITNRQRVQTGADDIICYQSTAAWASTAQNFGAEYLAGQRVFNESSFASPDVSVIDNISKLPGSSEDCLFLDVHVPESVFMSNESHPVMFWIHGGGYTVGWKHQENPSGLLQRAQEDGSDGVIWVSINYRLGHFGFLSGPSFETQGGTANAGLLDQRFALDWVQKNIHLFGGDPDNVTVIGESAGGGSIMFQLTAYGGLEGPVPFRRAIVQSPGIYPVDSTFKQDATSARFLEVLNVTTLAEARKLSSAALASGNIAALIDAPYGTTAGIGPAVDASFVPANPRHLLLLDKYDTTIEILAAHNTLDGLLFTSPYVQSDEDFEDWVLTTIPALKAYPKALEYATKTLYPPPGNASSRYTNQLDRGLAFSTDFLFFSHTFSLNTARRNNTYAYNFDVYPSLHGFDLAYTFYNGKGDLNSGVTNVTIAHTMQRLLTTFAKTGNPNFSGGPEFPIYGADAQVIRLSSTGINMEQDEAATLRNAWFQKVFYM